MPRKSKSDDSKKFSSWDMTIAEWMGQTMTALENLNVKIGELSKRMDSILSVFEEHLQNSLSRFEGQFNNSLSSLSRRMDELENKLGSIDESVTNIRVKVATTAATVSMLVSIFVILLSKII